MDYAALIAKAKSTDVRDFLTKLSKGETTKKQVVKRLTEYTKIPEKNTLQAGRSVQSYLDKYRDSLMILPLLQDQAKPNSGQVNAAVNAMKNSFTRRVSEKKSATKSAMAAETADRRETKKRERNIEKARAILERASAVARGEKPAAPAPKAANMERSARVASLRMTKGRAPEKAARVQATIASISLTKTPQYIQQVIDRLESQILRFNSKAKESTMASMRKKIRELTGDLADKQASGKMKPAAASEYAAKISAMEALYRQVEEETNVELSPAAAASTKKSRGKSTGPMSCRIIHHPCNPKLRISKEQLTEAALSIEETGTAPRIPEDQRIPQGSRSASAMTSAATSAATSAVGSPNDE